MELEALASLLNNIEEKFDFYLSVIMIPIGIFLNIISIFMFRRKRFNKTKMGFYYTILSITHTIALITYLTVINSIDVFGYNLLTFNDFFCKFFTFLQRPVRQIPPWIQVSLTVHRFVACKVPAKFDLINRSRVLYTIIFGAFFMICVLASGCFFFQLESKITQANNSTEKTLKCSASTTVYFITELGSYLFRILIPFMIIFVMNIILYFNIYKKVVRVTNIQNLKFIKRQNHFTYCCIILNVFYMATNLPLFVVYIVKLFYIGLDSYLARVVDSVWLLSYELSNMYFVTFFVWSVLFNSLFRDELVSIVSSLNPFR